jgi:hypothetical protein
MVYFMHCGLSALRDLCVEFFTVSFPKSKIPIPMKKISFQKLNLD